MDPAKGIHVADTRVPACVKYQGPGSQTIRKNVPPFLAQVTRWKGKGNRNGRGRGKVRGRERVGGWEGRQTHQKVIHPRTGTEWSTFGGCQRQSAKDWAGKGSGTTATRAQARKK